MKCKTSRVAGLVTKNVVAVRQKNYIEPGAVTSLIHYFDVEKGLEDIRMVHSGTGSGLNEAV